MKSETYIHINFEQGDSFGRSDFKHVQTMFFSI